MMNQYILRTLEALAYIENKHQVIVVFCVFQDISGQPTLHAYSFFTVKSSRGHLCAGYFKYFSGITHTER